LVVAPVVCIAAAFKKNPRAKIDTEIHMATVFNGRHAIVCAILKIFIMTHKWKKAEMV